MTAKRKHRSTNEYLRYLRGELTPEERYSFERDLEADPFDREAMEGMENMPASELEDDLLSIHASLNKRLKRRRRRTWYYAAATIASLLIVGTVFLNIYEINPNTASKSISGHELVLHEEASEEAAPEIEYKAVEAEVDETEVIVADADQDEAKVAMEVSAEAEEHAPVVVEAEEAAPVALDAEEPAPLAMEADLPAAVAGEVVADELVADELMADEMVADEVVVREAQPRRSEKKGRTAQAPLSYEAGRVRGIVVSAEDMEPLPGASILVKGTDSGMVADMEGRFNLVSDKQAQTTIIASYVGMETEEYRLDEGRENRVVMQPDMASLNEVVVIGSDAEESLYATGAVQRVNLDREESEYSGAEPEGGLEAFKMYIEEQIRFPAGDTFSKKEVVVLRFHVARDGTISNIRTLRSPGTEFTEEATRLLQQGPSWNPARNESGVIEDEVRIRIVFKK